MMTKTRLKMRHGLIGHELEGVRGDTFIVTAPDPVDRETHKDITIHVEGSALTDLVEGQIEGWPEFPRHTRPTETTADFDWRIVTPSKFTATIVTDSYRAYCITRLDGRALNPTVLKLIKGQEHVLKQGRQVFLAMGSFTINGTTHAAPFQIGAVTTDALLTAEDDVVAIEVGIR